MASSSWLGDAQLADNEHVERGVEGPRHPGRHRHPAPRQGEHEHVVPAM